MTDWLKVWEENSLGFHQSDYNQNLKDYFPVSIEKKVLVPLCGKSKDLLYLEETGHQVIGIELSPIACSDFFSENNIEYKQIEKEEHTEYVAINRNITLIQGDIFKVKIPKVDLIYDRASLIALPKENRAKIVTLFKETNAKQLLLITLEYDQTKADGPPYSVLKEEIKSYFSNFKIVKEELRETSIAKFSDVGINSVSELVYLIDLE